MLFRSLSLTESEETPGGSLTDETPVRSIPAGGLTPIAKEEGRGQEPGTEFEAVDEEGRSVEDEEQLRTLPEGGGELDPRAPGHVGDFVRAGGVLVLPASRKALTWLREDAGLPVPPWFRQELPQEPVEVELAGGERLRALRSASHNAPLVVLAVMRGACVSGYGPRRSYSLTSRGLNDNG